MKVTTMIKALILVHFWSLVVAGSAWVLQRDGNKNVGASFPASNVWLILIIVSFLPSVFALIPFSSSIDLPEIEGLDLFPVQVNDSAVVDSSPFNFLYIYIALCLCFISRTLWRWSRLQALDLMPTTEPDVFTTSADIPPLTLSWPRRAVVIPVGYKKESALIRHERAHLRHYDAELTLLLLLIQDVMLRNPGVSYLVRQWRLAIELRADHEAIKMLNVSERKNYASLLLNGLRSSGGKSVGRNLPCPTGILNSSRHRDVKMRLGEIMKNEPYTRKRRWSATVFFTTLAASVIGLTTSAATGTIPVKQLDFDPIKYSKKVLPQIPANCSGLKIDDLEYEAKDVTINGISVKKHIMNLGVVGLKHDVRRDGTIHNPRVLFSTHSCFEANAKAVIVQWKTDPKNFEIRDAGVKIQFLISAETVEELKLKLNDYFQ